MTVDTTWRKKRRIFTHGEHLLEELTPSELRVLRLAATGLEYHKIAARLGLSERSVRMHLSRVMAKLGVNSRLQAARYAWQTGLINPSDAWEQLCAEKREQNNAK